MFSFPYGSAGKASTCNVGDLGSISGLERSPGEGKGHTLQYSGLENPVACIVCGVAESDTTELLSLSRSFFGGSVVKNPPASAGAAGDTGFISGSGRSPGGGHGNPLQYSCLENPMDRGAWWATVHGVEQS